MGGLREGQASGRLRYTDLEAAGALVATLGGCRWDAVAIAHGFLKIQEGAGEDEVAHLIYQKGGATLKRSREIAKELKAKGFLSCLKRREKTGSAENPVTKLFPARVTKERFVEGLDRLIGKKPASLDYSDDRDSGHGLTDFTLREGDLALPINVKNAGTKFERAQDLVGFDPGDCVPIPAYKAFAALEAVPDLLYVVSIDFDLGSVLEELLPNVLTPQEMVAWDVLSRYAGARHRSAEDLFVSSIVRRHWEKFREAAGETDFYVISARKAVRILQTNPRRTPGLGLRAWGTGANAEVNVHVSVKAEMTPWKEVERRILALGLDDILRAINRKRREEVYDPEI